MQIEELFINELNPILAEEGFDLKKNEAGYLGIKKYVLGEKVIFFETSKKGKNSFRVGISIRITNLPVEKIHSLVNNKHATKSLISLRLNHLASKCGNPNANFERKKFKGRSGNIVAEDSIQLYLSNFEACLNSLILPFFKDFTDQYSFHKWLNDSVLNGRYNFEIEPTWKDAINGLIISKLVCSEDYETLFEIWFGKDLPKGPGFDTREELIQLHRILSSEKFDL